MAGTESSAIEGSDTSSDNESVQPSVELMITTRERRKTAGNRYSQVVAQEQVEDDAEDDVALLFAEAEGEDEEYNSDEADDEADMSSSDDDDQGPDAGADDLEGEKELQNQAKMERQKKRKAGMALTTMSAIRKKPKIDPTSLHRAPDKPKPSKRKERVSWLPDSDAAPGRTSLRKQTVAHRETMLERLKESEDQRLKNKAQREKKERLKQAEASKELTQADRLAEAARNERKNAKSLNRWEAREKERAAEQAAKLAALKDRKLSGAVLTFYSAAHVYQGLRPNRASPGPIGTDEVRVRKKYQRRSKVPIEVPSPATPTLAPAPTLSAIEPAESGGLAPSSVPTPTSTEPTALGTIIPNPLGIQQDHGLLAGIHEYASLPSRTESHDPQAVEVQVSRRTSTATNEPSHEKQEQWQESQSEAKGSPERSGKQDIVKSESQTDNTHAPALPQPDTTDQNTASTEMGSTQSMDQNMQKGTYDTLVSLPKPTPQPDAAHEMHKPSGGAGDAHNPTPVVEVISTRNLVVLDKFDELDASDRQQFSVFFNTKKTGKMNKTTTGCCAITGQPARYRDPVSGVGYANMNAYKKLKELQKHQYGWSSMLGCYVGRIGHVAKGVPEGFLG